MVRGQTDRYIQAWTSELLKRIGLSADSLKSTQLGNRKCVSYKRENINDVKV